MSNAPLPSHLAWLIQPGQGPDLAAMGCDSDLTGAYPWPAGMKLSGELGELAEIRGKRVADIGCGRGHLGLSALALGAAGVVFSDANAELVRFVSRTLECNGLVAQAIDHAWGTALPGAPFDLVLGGDILYHPPSFPALFATIAGSLADDGRCLLSDPRSVLEDELPDLAGANGLEWRCTRRDSGYSLVDLARRRSS